MQPVKELRLAAVLAAADEAEANTRCSLLCEAASLQRTLGAHMERVRFLPRLDYEGYLALVRDVDVVQDRKDFSPDLCHKVHNDATK